MVPFHLKQTDVDVAYVLQSPHLFFFFFFSLDVEGTLHLKGEVGGFWETKESPLPSFISFFFL